MSGNGKSKALPDYDRGYHDGRADERTDIIKWLRTRRALNLAWRMMGSRTANSETADLIEAGRHTMHGPHEDDS